MKAVILGVGRMGRRHIAAVRQLDLEVGGIYDVSQDSVQAAREECLLSEQQLFTDLEALYARGIPDLVVVATTAPSHCALTCDAAARGVRYIMVEKPMGVSLAECDRMIAACSAAGAGLAVNHQMRIMEQYSVPKQRFATPEYGGLLSMTVVAGNFGFAMNASHYFEAFRFLTDDPVVEVNAWFSRETVPNPRGAHFEARAGSLRAVTASGKRLYIEIGADQGHGVRAIYGCRNGLMVIDELAGEVSSSVREAQYRDLPTTRYSMPTINSQFAIKPADVIDSSAATLRALITGEHNVSGEDGRRSIEVLVAAHQSAERGGVAVLVSAADRTRVFPWA